MTTIERQKWERVRARGHARYIFRSFLFLGVPMWAAQTFGPFLYDAIMHKPYVAPFQIWSPALDFVSDMVWWIFGFGYLMGELMWRKHERDYDKDDHVA
jgi:hypothetical protein